MTPKWILMPGDVVDVLRTMPDASADAALFDPPYGLGTHEPTVEEIIAYLRGDRLDMGGDFMGKNWDVPPLAFWRELRRVLKPGATIMAFAGTRTVDLIALGIRAAGFEVRDAIGHSYDPLVALAEFVATLDEHQRRAFERALVSSPLMAWMHAQGFPKSLDVTKAIDRQREDRAAILKVTAFVREAAAAWGERPEGEWRPPGKSTAEIDEHMGTNGMAGHWTSAASQPAVPTLEQWAKLKAFLGFGDEMDAEVARLNERKGTPGEAFLERPVVGEQDVPDLRDVRPVESVVGGPRRLASITTAAQESSARWQGYGTALKPAWEPIILARVPLDGTVAQNAIKHGTGGINVDGCRVATGEDLNGGTYYGDRRATDEPDSIPGARPMQSLANGCGREFVQPAGRWPANVVLAHTPECRQVGTRKIVGSMATKRGGELFGGSERDANRNADVVLGYADEDGLEEVEAWDCAPGCPARDLDEQSGDRPGMSGGGVHRPGYEGGIFGAIDCDSTRRSDHGGASRFVFCAKADRSEREFGCDKLPARKGSVAVDRKEGAAGTKSPRAGAGRTAEKVRNFHPTVKPIALMKYLATLLLPPVRASGEPRRILVPYAGSGSEMIGALRAGWDSIVGIQRAADADERQYLEIARARLERWSQVRPEMDEDDVIAAAEPEFDERQPTLFGRTEGAIAMETEEVGHGE